MRIPAALLAAMAAMMLQGQSIVLTFDATFEGEPIALDSIRVLNLSQEGDTLIIFPDNSLTFISVGLAEHAQGAAVRIAPNPFSGSTELSFTTTASRWALRVHDASGRLVVDHSGQGVGGQRMRFQGGGSGMFILSLEQEGRRETHSIVAMDEGGYTEPQLVHLGGHGDDGRKSNRAAWAWQPGDALRYIGYAASDEIVLSAAIDEEPDASITHTFELANGVVCAGSPTVTDIDGNVYPAMQIGDQCWTAANLKTTRYRDGSTIPNVTDSTAWTQLTSGAWSNYNNSPGNDATYGKLYNWYAAANPNLCPQGWHVPTDGEWQQLESALGMPGGELGQTGYRGDAQNVGGKMKTTTLWIAPNTGATNESGFSGLPGGRRFYDDGSFTSLGSFANCWSASESGTETAWSRVLGSNGAGIYRFNVGNKRSGFCVRCVRD